MDQSTLHALALSYVAAMGTTVGGAIVMAFPRLQFKQLGILAGVAGGLMLSMIFFELIPEALESISFALTNVCFFAGILLFAAIVKLVPEQKFESFVSKPRAGKARGKEAKEYQKILLSGVVTAFGITVHNFPEGLAIFLASKKSTKLGLTLTAAMTLHNLPEGVAVALPIYFATGSRWEALKLTFLSGLAEPLGVAFASWFFPSSLDETAVSAMLAAVAGIMAFIVFQELLPHAVKYAGSFDRVTASVFVGMALMSSMLGVADHMM